MTMTYHLDPDFRRNPKTKLFCCNCQKDMKEGQGIKVTVNWDTWEVVEGGSDVIGTDCWKRIKNKDAT